MSSVRGSRQARRALKPGAPSAGSRVFDERMAAARDRAAAVEAVVALVAEDLLGSGAGADWSSAWSCTWRRRATRRCGR